ncbi:MAG: hypothetical protein NXI22_05470, partial [bacterium]|nr:hypothetical protein [bacterium]
EDHTALRQHLDDALDIDVELFDPFSSVTVGGELAEKLPEHHGRFAPLLGMLLDEAEEQSHDIDFLNPRRKEEKKQPILTYALGGTAAVLVLLTIGFFVWSGYAAKAKQIATLKSERAELQKFANDASELVAKVKSIDQWNASNVIWLDELSEVSEEFPPAKDARATLINASSLKTSGGVLWIEGVARDYDVIGQIEIAVDDDRHQVEGGGGSPNERVEGYTYGFKEKITVTQPSRDAEAEEQLVTETP